MLIVYGKHKWRLLHDLFFLSFNLQLFSSSTIEKYVYIRLVRCSVNGLMGDLVFVYRPSSFNDADCPSPVSCILIRGNLWLYSIWRIGNRSGHVFISLCYERVSVSFLKLILIKSQVMYYLLLFSRRTIVAIMYRGVARAARMCTQNARGVLLPRTFFKCHNVCGAIWEYFHDI